MNSVEPEISGDVIHVDDDSAFSDSMLRCNY